MRCRGIARPRISAAATMAVAIVATLLNVAPAVANQQCGSEPPQILSNTNCEDSDGNKSCSRNSFELPIPPISNTLDMDC